jgi:RNA polymerase sigma-70 factor (ECF subfamily)
LIERSDEELMVAYAGGERAAFDLLFARHAPKLHHVLVRGMRRPEDGKDLVQQTFLQLHRHRADYDATRAFRPWLYTIALNLKRQYLRTKGRRPESELDEMVERTLAHSPGEARFENRQLLELGLKRLAPDAAEVIVLHWFGDLSMGEIATMLSISESAAKVRAHRAYEALRSIFEQENQAREEPEVSRRPAATKSHGGA